MIKKSVSKIDKKKKLILSVLIGAAVIIIFLGAYIFQGLPSLAQLDNPQTVLASKVYGIDGELIGQFFVENRIEADLDSIPKDLVNALIATEDRHFYHIGVLM